MSATLDLDLIDKLDELIGKVELHLTRSAKVDDVQTYHRLRTVPGIGPILALVLLYEMHAVEPFRPRGQFLSYARLVRCAHESAGKKLGSGGKKIGNAHLRWAFAEAVCLFLRSSERGAAVEAEAGEEARTSEGVGDPGGTSGAFGVPHAAQAGSVRRGTLLDRPGQRTAGIDKQEQTIRDARPTHEGPRCQGTVSTATATRAVELRVPLPCVRMEGNHACH